METFCWLWVLVSGMFEREWNANYEGSARGFGGFGSALGVGLELMWVYFKQISSLTLRD